MGIQRQALVRAPGHLKFGDDTVIYSTTPIVVSQVVRRTDYTVDGMGRVRRSTVDRYLEITCRPAEFEGFGALMTPYATMEPGDSVFGNADKPLVFFGRDGKSRTFHAAAPTAFGIAGKLGEPVLNQLTFTAVIKNGAEPGSANAYYTEAAAAYPGDSAFSRAACITPALKASWGNDAPFDEFWLEEGLDIAFALDLQPDGADGLGTLDMKFQDCIVNARGVPVGVTLTELYTASDFDVALGEQNTERDLILSGNGFHFTAYGCQLEDPETGFSATRKIPGQALWTTNRFLAADNTLNPVFRLATAAPPPPGP